MAADAKWSRPRTVPVAKPARPGLAVSTVPDPESPPEEGVSSETIMGWAWSIGLHALLLVVMAFWYFAPPFAPPPRIDARLAGNEFGIDTGLDLHGGFDSPIALEEGLIVDSIMPRTLESAGEIVVSSKAFSTGQAPGVDSGGPNAGSNPGIGDGQGFGIARFGNGGERIQGVEVKVGDPQFTLIWDSDVDLDLHVLEPGGTEIYWEEPAGKLGGELDVDDRDGLGPENVYWLTDDPDGRKVKGRGPAGDYRWFVHYFAGFGGIDRPTNWKVRVKHNGRVEVFSGRLVRIDQQSKVYTLRFGEKPPQVDPLLEGVLSGRRPNTPPNRP